MASVGLYLFWDMSKSVYYCPYNVMNFSMVSLGTCLYRFVIGAIVSIFIILFVYKITEKPNRFSIVLASLGRETLFIYLGSFIINACMVKWLKIPEWFDYIKYIELYSFVYCAILLTSCYTISKLMRRNQVTSLLYLGEK